MCFRAQQARKGIKKQGSYEAAVESGAKNQAAAKRTKQILQIRKQDSYTKAIGGSFEDDHSQTSENREPVNKMRKQVGYFFEHIFGLIYFLKLLFLIVLFTKSCIWKDNICIQNIFLSMHILLTYFKLRSHIPAYLYVFAYMCLFCAVWNTAIELHTTIFSVIMYAGLKPASAQKVRLENL